MIFFWLLISSCNLFRSDFWLFVLVILWSERQPNCGRTTPTWSTIHDKQVTLLKECMIMYDQYCGSPALLKFMSVIKSWACLSHQNQASKILSNVFPSEEQRLSHQASRSLRGSCFTSKSLRSDASWRAVEVQFYFRMFWESNARLFTLKTSI